MKKFLYDESLTESENVYCFKASKKSKIKCFNGITLGNLMASIGAGRMKVDDIIEPDVSMRFYAYID